MGKRLAYMEFPTDHPAFREFKVNCEHCHSSYWKGTPQLLKALDLPMNCEVEISPHARFTTGQMLVRIEHPDLGVVPEAYALPEVEPVWRKSDKGREFDGWRIVDSK